MGKGCCVLGCSEGRLSSPEFRQALCPNRQAPRLRAGQVQLAPRCGGLLRHRSSCRRIALVHCAEASGFRAGRALLGEASEGSAGADPVDLEEVKKKFAEMDLQGSINRARCMREQKSIDAMAKRYVKGFKTMYKDGQLKKSAYKKNKEWVEKEHLFASAKLARKCKKLSKTEKTKTEKSELK